jgi:hypothetical protein
MKDKIYTDIICKEFCKYYKEGKEELLCNGYVFLRDNFTPHELKTMLVKRRESSVERLTHDAPRLTHYEIPDENKELTDRICRQCDFFVDGCDYINNQSGPPCGGYLIISQIQR